MDEQRALLAQLFSAVEPTKKKSGITFTDKKVCKYYLCGVCPYLLLDKTRVTIGRCPDIHDDELRMEYQKARQTRDFGYEREFRRFLEDLIRRVDREIDHLKRTLEKKPDFSDQMKAITDEISHKMEEAEKEGEKGNVSKAQQILDEVEGLKKKREDVKDSETHAGRVVESLSAYYVCDVCGAQLCRSDPDYRKQDHFDGKQHNGYLKLRAILKELAEKEAAADPRRKRTTAETASSASVSSVAAAAVSIPPPPPPLPTAAAEPPPPPPPSVSTAAEERKADTSSAVSLSPPQPTGVETLPSSSSSAAAAVSSSPPAALPFGPAAPPVAEDVSLVPSGGAADIKGGDEPDVKRARRDSRSSSSSSSEEGRHHGRSHRTSEIGSSSHSHHSHHHSHHHH